tara:strand:- start:16078 stop:17802 length:1725 start_codon:yes stop_codon:yes gene_type:complete
MAESKRIFNQAKIDRDLDARLLPPGVYRDGLNVNVGESEGGDVGAVENLKGNEEIANQTSIEGTTIGSVRDPDSNKIYWFNKGATTDAIYEYDEQAGAINTILKDKVSRPLIKPKCAPDFNVFLDPVPDDAANRSDLNIVFTTPLGGCTDPTKFGYDPLAEWDNGTCTNIVYGCTDPTANNYVANANTDDGSCSYTAPTTLGVTLSNPGGQTNGASVSVTSNVTNALGSISYDWKINNVSTGNTNSSDTYTGSNTTVTKTLVITDAGRTAPNNTANDSTSVTFSAAPPYLLNASTTTSLANCSVSGSITNQQGVHGVQEPVTFTASIIPDQGYEWSGSTPTFTVTGLPSGVNFGTVSGGTSGNSAATVLIDGDWTPANSVTINVNWTGGTISQVPTGNHTLNISNVGSGLGSNITTSIASYSVTKAVGTTTAVNFNASCSPASGYEWVTLPSLTPNNLPSGVTAGSTTGAPVGGTGARLVSVSGNWTPTSAGTTNADVTWSGGSVQTVPPACNNYQVTYTGNNGQLNYTDCSSGSSATYNLPNSSGTNVIVMQSRTYPTQGAGSGYTIHNISQI